MPEQSFSAQFITSILTKAKVVNEKGEVNVEYVERLAEQLDKKMGLFVLGKLSVDEIEVYSRMAEEGASGEEMSGFLKDKITDFVELQEKFFDDYAYNFFTRAAKIRESLS